MSRRITVPILLALIFQTLACAGQDVGWEKRAEARADKIITKNGTGTNQRLKKELLAMYDTDQGIRKRMREAGPEQQTRFDAELAQTDRQITRRLKRIVAEYGWPTVALVGPGASQGAAVMLVHSPDHAWQKQLLPRLLKLVDEGKIFGSDVAGLADRILVSEGKPQRFGTQFKTVNGRIVLWPIDDPEHVEERRARYLLPPMDVYRKTLGDMYHMPVDPRTIN